jgi:hypothetical protein
MSTKLTRIKPELDRADIPGYQLGHWGYPERCANVELALTSIKKRIEEWDQKADPHGWWHERPQLIAMYNEIVRLRSKEEV